MATSDHYDVIVIGTGAGGGTLAHTLARVRASGSCCSSGATSCPARRENWEPEPVFVDGRYISPDTWYDADGTAVPAAGPLLRRRGDEAVRRRALPAAPAGLRRAQARRRRLAGVAAQLRRLRALVHEGRVALPGARQPRRGPDRGSLVASSTRGRRCRTSRGSRRSPTTWPPRGYHPFPAPCGILLDEADRARSTCIRCTWCDGYPCLVHAKSDAETIAVRPLLDRPERDAARRRRGA